MMFIHFWDTTSFDFSFDSKSSWTIKSGRDQGVLVNRNLKMESRIGSIHCFPLEGNFYRHDVESHGCSVVCNTCVCIQRSEKLREFISIWFCSGTSYSNLSKTIPCSLQMARSIARLKIIQQNDTRGSAYLIHTSLWLSVSRDQLLIQKIKSLFCSTTNPELEKNFVCIIGFTTQSNLSHGRKHEGWNP